MEHVDVIYLSCSHNMGFGDILYSPVTNKKNLEFIRHFATSPLERPPASRARQRILTPPEHCPWRIAEMAL